jgi:hypothetical protein
MREIRPIDIPSQEARVEKKTFVKCTFCGVEARYFNNEKVDWFTPGRGFGVAETGIFIKTGDSFPEGGFGEYKDLHVCPDCMEQKVVPALEALGVKFETTDWER